ncbi:hypothetical protein [Parvularcula dongshanensis]|uniref:Uncharacterized protein n=1 Tax=Parvularcula dongshanensis TaxID=1173995 RepID=A0A840HZ06_9PROT|nr:hypothetical protein [Parvularcula dongshanensis]MBB4658076.1 hypothetical protein [Parvularcula dongshanensis]
MLDDDDLPEIGGPEFAALEREAPVLSRLRRFAEGLDRIPWFSRLGEAPTPSLRESAQGYLDRLGFPDAEVAILPTWEDAADAAETTDWSSPAWEAEELARADLTARALGVISEEALEIGLRLVAARAGEAAQAAMEEEAAYWDMESEDARNLAVGAAAQASHLAALALVAAAAEPDEDAGDSIFAWKLRLFMEGRWPVAVLGSSFNIF